MALLQGKGVQSVWDKVGKAGTGGSEEEVPAREQQRRTEAKPEVG